MRVLFIFTSTFSAVALIKGKITVISSNKPTPCWIEQSHYQRCRLQLLDTHNWKYFLQDQSFNSYAYQSLVYLATKIFN